MKTFPFRALTLFSRKQVGARGGVVHQLSEENGTGCAERSPSPPQVQR